jgi:transposase
MRLQGPLAAATIDAAVDAESFIVWTREVLAPCLRVGDVVVMDNLPAHKNPRVAEAIEAAGARLVYLPPYSPDFNPIEPMWSKVKASLNQNHPLAVEPPIRVAFSIDSRPIGTVYRYTRFYCSNSGTPIYRSIALAQMRPKS